MKNKIKVKCILTDDKFYHIKGKLYTIEVTDRIGGITRGKISDERGRSERLIVRSIAGNRGLFRVAGFEATFEEHHHRFRKTNRSAAIGQVDINYFRCKRSIRNQARNIAKELPSCGKLDKIARNYGK